MQYLKQLLCILTIISVFEACKKAPISCFTTDKSTATVNTPIKCDASCSKNAKNYIWSGAVGLNISGDGSSSTETFTATGKYLIKLEVTNGNNSDIIAHTVTIN